MTAPILVFDAEDLTIGMRDILLSLERRRPAIFRSERVFLEQASEGRCLPSLDRSDQSPALDIDALRPPPDSDEGHEPKPRAPAVDDAPARRPRRLPLKRRARP